MNVLICDDDASTRFVLLLLDREMPALSGFEVLEVLRESESLREMPVVIVSPTCTCRSARRPS